MEPRAALLKSSFDIAHMVFNAVVGNLDDALASSRMNGGNVPPAAAIIAHAVFSEDFMVNGQVRGRTTVLSQDGLQELTGIRRPGPSMTPEWVSTPFSISGLRTYAAAVFAETDTFLRRATQAEMDRSVTTPLGTEVIVAEYLASFGVVHLSEHTGEVSALKGAHGLQGLPF
jgi:hypothetical protein